MAFLLKTDKPHVPEYFFFSSSREVVSKKIKKSTLQNYYHIMLSRSYSSRKLAKLVESTIKKQKKNKKNHINGIRAFYDLKFQQPLTTFWI